MSTPTHEHTPPAQLPGPEPATAARGGTTLTERVHPVPRGVSYAVPLVALLVAALLWLVGGVHGALALVAGYLTLLLATYTAYRAAAGRRVAVDRTMRALVHGAFVLALLPLVSLLWTVVAEGAGLAFDPAYLTQTMNGVTGLYDQAHVEDGAPMVGGAYHAIVGTLVITGLTTLISVPVGIFTAIYLVEYGTRGRISGAIRFLVDVMTGIPSIVAGLFAFALWAVLFGIGTKNAMAGAVALAVLMIPTVVRNSEEMLRIVPNELREAALALGVPKWRVIAKVVLPTAASGLASGVTLAIARVIGETAPLLVAVGYARGLNLDPTDGPMNSLAVYAYYMFTRPLNPGFRDPSLERAWAAALLLVLIVVALNLTARLVAKLFAPKTGR
jgi:phosphate transport system permease protein